MDHHPPDDRRIASGAVAAAWAMVAALTALVALASALAPPQPPPHPPTQQAALHAGGCIDDGEAADRPDRSLRD
jgi:hypothetical protein